ncbi:MAG: aldehyde reductase, partial [Oleiphilaceae bacterium]|nr:aldehyde reductase [Oleiphilaceae bacterium]
MSEPKQQTQKVCVTGASGFIAAHLVKQLLEQGYEVTGTVRGQADDYPYLTNLPGAQERLQLVQADLLKKGAFDAAVADCDVVMHTASPYVVNVKNPQKELVEPALQGTTNVLRSCLKSASVKRVVLTSSMAAITDQPDSNKVFSEADWNEKSSLQRNPYYYSKTLAEKAAWDFVDQHNTPFDLVVINPYMVIGPSLGPGLNESNKVLRDMMSGVYPTIMSVNWGFVDVRDVAKAHVLAMQTPTASGRYLVVSNDNLKMS